MKIKTKLFLNLFLIAVVGLLAIFLIVYFFSHDIIIRTIAGYNTLVARSEITAIDRAVYERIERWESFIEANPFLLTALNSSNTTFAAMLGRDRFIQQQDEAWKNSDKEFISPFMREIIDNYISDNLRLHANSYQKKYGYTMFPEVFLTNRYGVLVASTGKTSDYLQSDEDWWQKTKADGLWVGNLAYDDSSDINALEFDFRIDDKDDNFLGILKVVYDIRDIFSVIDESIKQYSAADYDATLGFSRKTTEVSLITETGELIYSTNKGIGNLTPAKLSSFLNKSGNYLVIEDKGVEELYSHAHSTGYLGYKGLGWILVIEKATQEVFAPLSLLTNWLLLSMFIIIVAIIIVSLFLATSLNKPIKELISTVKKIEGGDLNARINIKNKDEFGQLAEAFNSMVLSVKNSRKEVDEKVAFQTTDIRKKAEELSSKQKALLNVLEDVDAEKNKLVLAKAQDEAILTGIGDGVFVLDTERRIILFNPIAESISGFSSAEALGQPYDKILNFTFEKTGAVNEDFVNEAMVKGVIAKMANHTQLTRKDGTKVPVADSAAPIKDANGKIFGCVVVFRDVTKEREIDKMKSEFVSVASHQLRTPLTGIKWFSELLLKGKLPATTKDYVNQIIVSTERMVRLVDDLLNVSRIETGRKFDIILKHVDIVPVVKSVIQEQLPGAIEKKLELNCAANAPKELILSIDELKMRQVFQNLVNNAIKYSRENTTIEVGCDQTKKDEVTFYVRDHGVGIPQKQQVQVFNKFFRAENVMTLHTDGTGLGLYIAKAIVEAHHGKIWFESEENKGTTFFFTLPTKLVPETVVAEPKSDETPVANPVAVAKKIEK